MSLGVVECLVATALSGLAGSLSQKGLQMTGISGRNAYLYTVEVSFYSAVCLFVSLIVSTRFQFSGTSFFQSCNASTLLPICLKACGGLLTAFVHKHAGSVTKGFALILGLVLTGVIQAVLDKKTLSRDQMMGTGLVLLSSWLHFTNPP
jgi:UDP-sugar transporter A1/2/3